MAPERRNDSELMGFDNVGRPRQDKSKSHGSASPDQEKQASNTPEASAALLEASLTQLVGGSSHGFVESLCDEYIASGDYTNISRALLGTENIEEQVHRLEDVPPEETLTEEQHSVVSAAVDKRQKQIRQWMRWHAGSGRNRSANKMSTGIVDNLLKPKTHVNKPWEIYAKIYYKDRVKDKTNVAGGGIVAVRQSIQQAFENESEDIKNEVENIRVQQVEAARKNKKKGKQSTPDATSDTESIAEQDPAIRRLNIQECGPALERILQHMGRKTGWKFTVIMGGPDPLDLEGNNIITSLHTGRNELGNDFSDAYSKFDTEVVQAYGEFLDDVFRAEGRGQKNARGSEDSNARHDSDSKESEDEDADESEDEGEDGGGGEEVSGGGKALEMHQPNDTLYTPKLPTPALVDVATLIPGPTASVSDASTAPTSVASFAFNAATPSSNIATPPSFSTMAHFSSIATLPSFCAAVPSSSNVASPTSNTAAPSPNVATSLSLNNTTAPLSNVATPPSFSATAPLSDVATLPSFGVPWNEGVDIAAFLAQIGPGDGPGGFRPGAGQALANAGRGFDNAGQGFVNASPGFENANQTFVNACEGFVNPSPNFDSIWSTPMTSFSDLLGLSSPGDPDNQARYASTGSSYLFNGLQLPQDDFFSSLPSSPSPHCNSILPELPATSSSPRTPGAFPSNVPATSPASNLMPAQNSPVNVVQQPPMGLPAEPGPSNLSQSNDVAIAGTEYEVRTKRKACPSRRAARDNAIGYLGKENYPPLVEPKQTVSKTKRKRSAPSDEGTKKKKRKVAGAA
ncbi:hypothetical protein BV22DRAFT_1135383 [Leucogyrophana mollusca]|uniref:Uncharacterized protein n=1 Tax=Leucogyrophana mollusca TaxID=85980 RepID=A0ACB8AVS5_9AGAM|nr:hypothetical protein BV22DRAFT_1135383 [Leucogyrophana mollusca]